MSLEAQSRTKFDLVVFDFDGTLVDTSPVICHAFAECVRGTPAERGADHFRQQLGKPLEHVHAHLLDTVPEYSQPLGDFLERYRVAHDAVADRQYRLFAGVTAMLIAVRRSGAELAIASTKPTSILSHHAALLAIDHHFGHIQGTDDFPFKPDPEILHRVWARLPASTARTVFVGDATSDMQTGVAAGTVALGVSYGAHSRSELLDAGAERVFDHPAEHSDYLSR